MDRAGRCGIAVRAVRRCGIGSCCRKTEAGDPAPSSLRFVEFHKILPGIPLDGAGSYRERIACGDIADVGAAILEYPHICVFFSFFYAYPACGFLCLHNIIYITFVHNC